MEYKMSKITLQEIAKYYGKSKNSFYTMKYKSPDKFKLVFSFDDNRLKSVQLFKCWIVKMRNDIAELIERDESEAKAIIKKHYENNTVNLSQAYSNFCLMIFTNACPLNMQMQGIRQLETIHKKIGGKQ